MWLTMGLRANPFGAPSWRPGASPAAMGREPMASGLDVPDVLMGLAPVLAVSLVADEAPADEAPADEAPAGAIPGSKAAGPVPVEASSAEHANTMSVARNDGLLQR